MRKFAASPFREIPPARAIGLCAIVFIIGLGVLHLPIGEYLRNRVMRPFQFQARSRLGAAPEISDKLVVYSYDDSLVAEVDDDDIPLTTWVDILEGFIPNAPRAVVIDKLFRHPRGREASKEFVARMARLPYPVITGTLIMPDDGGHALDTKRPEYELSRLTDRPQEIDWLEVKGGFAEGASSSVAEALRRAGHINYPDEAHFDAFHRLDADTVIPQMALLLGKRMRLRGDHLELDGDSIPLDARGRILINYLNPKDIINYSLIGPYKRSKIGKPSKIPSGATILLAYTPSLNTDVVVTPFGKVPGGFVVASMLNSVLTRQWIRTANFQPLLLLLVCLSGGLVGCLLCGRGFWLAALSTTVGISALGNALFSWASIETDWLFLSFGHFLAAAAVFAERSRLIERRTRRMRTALDGLVPPQQLLAMVRNARPVRPRSVFATAMFIDIAGFSRTTETQSPEAAFDGLRGLMGDLTRLIHGHGGVIDKSVGDGLLCLFGYQYGADTTSDDHARTALECAAEIQRHMLRRNLASLEKGEPSYPLRIGLNSGQIYVGDLGNEERMDVTLIGHTINFAKRMESACEEYGVLMGTETYALLGAAPKGMRLSHCFVPMKHYDSLVPAYQCDPLPDRVEVVYQAVRKFRESLGIDRKFERFDVPPRTCIAVRTKYGEGTLANFSQFGVGFQLGSRLAPGSIVELELGEPGSVLGAELAHSRLNPLIVEIRWARETESGILHGAHLKNINKPQGEMLVELFLHEIQRHNAQLLGVAHG